LVTLEWIFMKFDVSNLIKNYGYVPILVIVTQK
jgi:hypothetical protein